MYRQVYLFNVLFIIIIFVACTTLKEAANRAGGQLNKGSKNNVRSNLFKERPSYEPFNPIDIAPIGYTKLGTPILHESIDDKSIDPIDKKYTILPYNIRKVKKEITLRLGYPTDMKGNYYLLHAKQPIMRIEMINDGDTCYIKKYTLREKHNVKPYRISLLLDHSGSMGDERCRELQNAISSVFKSEKIQHEISVIKFDSEVSFEGKSNNNNIDQIVKRRIGMEGFGGSTSIFDALYFSIENFVIDSNYQPLIILFSDGYENSSTQNDIKSIIDKAKSKSIPIFTSAFGQGSDTLLLKTIADETNGAFWYTFGRDEFTSLFSNKIFLLNNYYEISLVPCSFDYQKINFVGKANNGGIATGEKSLLGFKEVISLNINFQFDKSFIEPRYKEELDKIAEYLKRNSSYSIIIYGHTDNAGTKEYNQSLSLERAEAVSQSLISRGLRKNRIKIVGRGEEEPFVPNTSEENKYRNRRIEIELLKD
ncbi:MAG: OmpA family protein [Sphingobacteriales bacterium]|jgi:outer membrane protein OmpA-like peptidoglycan-associated protein/uncharacterized protein YegL